MMDEFFNMDQDIEALWSRSSPLKRIKTKATNTNEIKEDTPHGAWTEMSSTVNTVRQGPRVVSHRTVRVRDDSGRNELLEERNLDGRVSKRMTDFSSNKQIKPSQSGTAVGVSTEDKKESQTMVTSSSPDEFDQLWEKDDLVQQLFEAHNQKKIHKHPKKLALQTSQPQQQAKAQPVEQPVPMQTTENTAEAKLAPAPVTTPTPISTPTTVPAPTPASTPVSEFSSQLEQIAQLGLPCDSSAYHLLQLTNGSVEQTVMGILSLQRMKALGFEDDAKCLNALCSNSFNIEKTCQQLRATQ